jgi:hypothetical protein
MQSFIFTDVKNSNLIYTTNYILSAELETTFWQRKKHNGNGNIQGKAKEKINFVGTSKRDCTGKSLRRIRDGWAFVGIPRKTPPTANAMQETIHLI